MDVAYGKKHPGWQRYIGARAEYKVFREGELYKAIQVISPGGQTVPDELYRRVLLEFGGIDNYEVQSTDRKGKYLVEHGVAKKGAIALTIYRKSSDLSLKGLVLYYR